MKFDCSSRHFIDYNLYGRVWMSGCVYVCVWCGFIFGRSILSFHCGLFQYSHAYLVCLGPSINLCYVHLICFIIILTFFLFIIFGFVSCKYIFSILSLFLTWCCLPSFRLFILFKSPFPIRIYKRFFFSIHNSLQ